MEDVGGQHRIRPGHDGRGGRGALAAGAGLCTVEAAHDLETPLELAEHAASHS